MLHIVQCDDPSLLPFARTRLGVMRGLGLQHLSQKYDCGGVTVRVQKSGEHEYVWISGMSTLPVMMDSGVVNLIGVQSLTEDSAAAGILFESGSVFTYNVAFTLPETPVPAYSVWRRNTVTKRAHQASGTLQVGQGLFTGYVPPDKGKANSFAPEREKNLSGVWVDKVDYEGAIVSKKLTANICPASVFTGRCRLYVQAMYGAHLYKYAVDGTTGEDRESKPWAYITPYVGGIDGNGPFLMLAPYREEGDVADYDDVRINTSSGVYLDPRTGKFYLTTIYNGIVTTYYLVPAGTANALTYALRTAGVEAALYSPEDRERIEAYILSTCRPDVKNKHVVGTNTVSTGWTMGYGWHWNWDGTAADIVVATPYGQDPDPEGPKGMESYHHRVTLTFPDTPVAENGTLSSEPVTPVYAFTTLSGPSRWSLPRVYFCICEPQWSNLTIIKTTPKETNLIESSAPFYVFYARNELRLCSVQVTYVPSSVPAIRIRTGMYPSDFADAAYHGTIPGYTWGEDSASAEDVELTEAHYALTFTLGAEVFSGLTTAKNTNSAYYAVTGVTRVTDYPYPSSGWNPSGAFGVSPATVYEGYPPHSPMVVGVETRVNTSYAHWEWYYESSTKQKETYAQAAIVVPLFDSEAIYFWKKEATLEGKDGSSTYLTSFYPDNPAIVGALYGKTWWVQETSTYPTVTVTSYEQFGSQSFGDGRTISNTTIAEPVVETSSVINSYLISKSGAVDAEFSSMHLVFLNSEEQISGTYATYTGVKTDSPIIVAPGRVEPVGAPATIDLDLTSETTILSPPFALVGIV